MLNEYFHLWRKNNKLDSISEKKKEKNGDDQIITPVNLLVVNENLIKQKAKNAYMFEMRTRQWTIVGRCQIY